MPVIDVTVRDKVATAAKDARLVCGNSDYIIAFNFDEEWAAYETKTARFSYSGTYQDVVFTGTECPVPVIQNTIVCAIGVYAGDLHTTTPAYVPCKKSILCGNGAPADPPDDVYAQIMELLNKLDTEVLKELVGNMDDLETADKSSLVAAINEAAQTGGGGGEGTVKSVNGVLPDEAGDVDIEPTDDDALEVLAETGIIDPVSDADGALYTDADETIFSL